MQSVLTMALISQFFLREWKNVRIDDLQFEHEETVDIFEVRTSHVTLRVLYIHFKKVHNHGV